jgi:steroid 5-alpha reductase family enzyme
VIPISEALQIAGLTVAVYMATLYIVSKITKDASIVDVGWGLGFVCVATAIAIDTGADNDLYRFVQVLVSLWGLRLFVHILFRKAGKPEDWRYKNWREEWGSTYWWRSLLQIFALQGVIDVRCQ